MDSFDMEQFLENYLTQIALLRKKITVKKHFDEAKQLALDIHSMTHSKVISSFGENTFYDNLIDGLREDDYSAMPKASDETIAWHIWHIARIEDIVANLLIAKTRQVFDDEWIKRMNTPVKDTGNAMTDAEIIGFSSEVVKPELLAYRNAVGSRTREIITTLAPGDIAHKAAAEDLARLLPSGCLTAQKDSIWLKDFWGRLTVGGMLCLPLTRHHMMHLPDSYAIKEYLQLQ